MTKTFKVLETIPVKSSKLKTVGYTDSNDLVVEFSNGSKYLYEGVPKDVYEALHKSESVGSYLSKNIKNVYKYIKLPTEG